MGRPINRKWFGTAVPGDVNPRITITGAKFADGVVATGAVIVKQTGAKTYVVSRLDGRPAESLHMVDGNSGTAGLLPGQCYIKVRPFGGVPVTCEKIQQYRVSVHGIDGTIRSYGWSTTAATKDGQADLFF